NAEPVRFELSTRENGGFRLDANGEPPALKVYIRRTGPPREGRLFWTVDPSGDRATPKLPPVLSGASAIGAEREQHVRTGLAALGVPRGSGAAAPDRHVTLGFVPSAPQTDHVALLRGVGYKLYRDATPQCFKDVYWALREKYGDRFSIQFLT